MATSKRSAETDTALEEESLSDFTFNDENFFGVKENTLGTEKVQKASKAARTGDDLEDDDDGTPTNLDEEKDKNKNKTKATKKKEDEEDEEEVEAEFFEDKKEKTKPPVEKAKPVKAVVKKEEEAEDEDDKEEDDEDDDKKDEDDDEIFGTLASELKEKGIFANVEIPKDGKITEEKFFELQDQEIEARVDETFEAFFKEMSDEGKAFLKFMKNGGDAHTFVTQYGQTLNLPEFDEEKPEQVNKVLSHYLRVHDRLEDEEFEDRMKYIKDSGKEKATATRYYKILKKDDDDRKAAILEIQEKATKKKELDAKEFEEELREVIGNTDKIGVFTITKAEQKELADYITKPVVKVGKNKYVPTITAEVHRIMSGEKEADKKDLILLAKLIKNKFKLPEDIINKVNTKVISNAKSKLAEAKRGTRLSSSGSMGKKSLADFIDE